MIEELEEIRLPEYVWMQIFLIEKPYDEYFSDKMSNKLEAINNLTSDSVKLKALMDLDNESQEFLDKYLHDYSEFLVGFDEWISVNRPDDETRNASFSQAYVLFFHHEEIYRFVTNKLTQTIKQLKAKIEIEDVYKVNKYNRSNRRKKVPLNAAIEFPKIFVSTIIAREFICILLAHEFISPSEKWQGISCNRGELREAYQACKKLNLIKPEKDNIDSLRIFYMRFGLRPEGPGNKDPYISLRSLSDKMTTKDHDVFMKLLQSLTVYIKK
jgi:hypothetical protein